MTTVFALTAPALLIKTVCLTTELIKWVFCILPMLRVRSELLNRFCGTDFLDETISRANLFQINSSFMVIYLFWIYLREIILGHNTSKSYPGISILIWRPPDHCLSRIRDPWCWTLQRSARLKWRRAPLEISFHPQADSDRPKEPWPLLSLLSDWCCLSWVNLSLQCISYSGRDRGQLIAAQLMFYPSGPRWLRNREKR